MYRQRCRSLVHRFWKASVSGWTNISREKTRAHRRRSAPKGTEFQLRIWRLAQQIPFGYTATYGTLAKEAAREMGIPKMSAQAVGGAMKRNPIAILIPCHRVVGANGKLGGYFGNDRRKIDLLTLEGQDMRGFSK